MFPSATEAGLYLIKKFGIIKRNLELDRIDNNGNYARGNIRFVSRMENCANRRITVLSKFSQSYWPYAETVVRMKLSKGMSREKIIEDAKQAVISKRKKWRLINARLEFMTYEMPESIIVLPYRAS